MTWALAGTEEECPWKYCISCLAHDRVEVVHARHLDLPFVVASTTPFARGRAHDEAACRQATPAVATTGGDGGWTHRWTSGWVSVGGALLHATRHVQNIIGRRRRIGGGCDSKSWLSAARRSVRLRAGSAPHRAQAGRRSGSPPRPGSGESHRPAGAAPTSARRAHDRVEVVHARPVQRWPISLLCGRGGSRWPQNACRPASARRT